MTKSDKFFIGNLLRSTLPWRCLVVFVLFCLVLSFVFFFQFYPVLIFISFGFGTVRSERVHTFSTNRAELLEAWLALTSVKYHDNLLTLMPLNHWLALTMLRTTGLRWCKVDHMTVIDPQRSWERAVICCHWKVRINFCILLHKDILHSTSIFSTMSGRKVFVVGVGMTKVGYGS